jgi:DNA-binding response OmpR family regulator
MDELVARVRALIRRPQILRSDSPEYAGLTVLPDKQCMTSATDSITLAPAELQLMLSLVRARGEAVRRGRLEAAAWGLQDAVTPNALDVALHRLRRKLTAIDCHLQILNIRSLGYALKPCTPAA